MSTLAELLAERDSLHAAIRRIVGTATEPGMQRYSAFGRSTDRASLEVLYKRLDRVELDIARLGGASGAASGGMWTHPVFPPR